MPCLNCDNNSREIRDAVFKPLEEVKLTEGMRVEGHVPDDHKPQKRKSIRDSPIFGIWADREDIPDGVTYEDRLLGHSIF